MEPIFRQNYTVTDNEVDCFGLLKPSMILFYAQDVAGQHCIELGTDYDTMAAKRLFWAVIRHRVQINRMPCRGQRITVETWPMPTTRVAYPRALAALDAAFIGDTSEKVIYLTFDAGYENGYTAPILDTLKEKNVKAVFFLTGDYAERNPQLVRRMIDEGHIIGNHGMKHASLPSLSVEDAKNEIMSLHDFVKEKYNYEMTYFRPPCGEYSEQSMAVCNELGYKTLLWSFAYQDWDVNNQPDPAAAFDKVSNAAHGGGIYLLHSVSSTNAEILPRVIDSLREQGFELALPTV